MFNTCGNMSENLRTRSSKICVHMSTVLGRIQIMTPALCTIYPQVHCITPVSHTVLSTQFSRVSSLLVDGLYPFSTGPITSTTNFKKENY